MPWNILFHRVEQLESPLFLKVKAYFIVIEGVFFSSAILRYKPFDVSLLLWRKFPLTFIITIITTYATQISCDIIA